MALSCKQHKMLPLQIEKNGLRQAEELKNQKPVYGRVKEKDKSLDTEVLHGSATLCSGNE